MQLLRDTTAAVHPAVCQALVDADAAYATNDGVRYGTPSTALPGLSFYDWSEEAASFVISI